MDMDIDVKMPPPGNFAKPDYQGSLEVCTRFALSKSLVDGFMKKIFVHGEEVDIDQLLVTAVLLNEHKDGDGKWPEEFNNKIYQLIDSQIRYWKTQIFVEKFQSVLDFLSDVNSNAGKHTYVMVYPSPIPTDPTAKHCIYVEQYDANTGKVHCINSDPNNPKPKILANKTGNIFYKISCSATQMTNGPVPGRSLSSQTAIIPAQSTTSGAGPVVTTSPSSSNLLQVNQKPVIFHQPNFFMISSITGPHSGSPVTLPDIVDLEKKTIVMTSMSGAAEFQGSSLGIYQEYHTHQSNKSDGAIICFRQLHDFRLFENGGTSIWKILRRCSASATKICWSIQNQDGYEGMVKNQFSGAVENENTPSPNGWLFREENDDWKQAHHFNIEILFPQLCQAIIISKKHGYSANPNIPEQIPGRYLATEYFSSGRQVFRHVSFADIYLAVNPYKSRWQVVKLTSYKTANTLLQGPKFVPDICAARCYKFCTEKKWAFKDYSGKQYNGEHFVIECETHLLPDLSKIIFK